MSETATVWCQRGLNEDEFNVIKPTPMYRRMLMNRIRMTIPMGQEAARSARNEISNWLANNCNHLYHEKNVSVGRIDIFFLDQTDASGFKIVWSGREYI